MKIALLMLAMMLAAETPTKELVEAAKDAKKKRKDPSTKVLTNKDVKNAKGKLIVLPESAAPAAEEKKADGPTPLEKHDANYRARLVLEAKLEEARSNVAALEKQLQDLESRYYEENDPDRRDRLIRKEFEETQEKLEEARAELEKLHP